MIPLKLNNDMKARLMREFAQKLEQLKNLDETIKIEQKVAIDSTEPVRVVFTAKAFMQMLKLVFDSSKEIAWHGIVDRTGDFEFVIRELLLYPQQVTGSTVTTDEKEYAEWLDSQPDEVFNKIRFQGHSHVNMGVSPSSVDLDQQDVIVRQLQGEDYYIFAIVNKKLEINTFVYDFKTGMKYTKKDIVVVIENDDVMAGMDAIELDMDAMVSERKLPAAKKDDSKKEDKKKKNNGKEPRYNGLYYENDYDCGGYGYGYYS